MPSLKQDLLDAANAIRGAYSRVTSTEAGHDRSVTLDVEEAAVLQGIISPDSIKRKGGVADDGNPERHTFFVHPRNNLTDWHSATLALTYPKASKNELRLYMSIESGFAALSGDYFYILAATNGGLHVGFMDQQTFDQVLHQPQLACMAEQPYTVTDMDDEAFQSAVSGSFPGMLSQSVVTRYPRSVANARKALEQANYRCEIDPTHKTFISAATGQSYVEAHHLVPISAQSNFKESSGLDVPANIVALCPTCHRHLHLGSPGSKRVYLEALYARRSGSLQQSGINIQLSQLLAAYNMNA